MKLSKTKINGITKYIDSYPKNVQKELKKIVESVLKLAPEVEQIISYGMPTFKLNGKNLVHFAGYKNHIGFYPTPSGVSAFKKDLVKYKTSKGAIQFPIDKPLPLALIRKIVRFRIKEFKVRK